MLQTVTALLLVLPLLWSLIEPVAAQGRAKPKPPKVERPKVIERSAEREKTLPESLPGERPSSTRDRDPLYWSHTDPRLKYQTNETRSAVEETRQLLRQFAKLSGRSKPSTSPRTEAQRIRDAVRGADSKMALPDPTQDEVIKFGQMLYDSGKFADARAMFTLANRRADYFAVGLTDSGIASVKGSISDAVYARRYETARGPESGRWLQRLENREAVTNAGDDVLVFDLLGDSSFGRGGGDQTAAMSQRQVHICGSRGVDAAISTDTVDALRTRIIGLGVSTFAGTVIVGARAAHLDVDVRSLFPRAFVAYDPAISPAIAALRKLETRRIRSGAATIAILLPRNAQQQMQMGLAWRESDRAEIWKTTRTWTAAAKGTIVTWRSNGFSPAAFIRKLWSKMTDREVVLDALTKSSDVLILFAHGDSEHIVMPDGSTLTSKEVSELRLANRPVVLLLSCEGLSGARSDATIAMSESLKAAGATAVWGFEQKVDAREALFVAQRFAEEAEKGTPTLETIRTVTEQRARSAPAMRLKLE